MRTALSIVPRAPDADEMGAVSLLEMNRMDPDGPEGPKGRLAPDPLLGLRLDGRYTLEALIGEGATGRVYRARQEATGREVAVKLLRETLVLDAQSVKRFQREARAASRINHPNAIMVHDFGQSAQGHVYLVTELIDGETLRARLQREGVLPAEQALWIFGEIVAGVAAAHECGVVHRDLHPGNIFLCRDQHGDERVKVFDFGGARVVEGPGDAEVTGAGHLDLGRLLGSIRYLPPESLQRDRAPDPRVDVYALGLILFELCTGRYPFDAEDPLQVMAMHLREPPPLLSAYAPERRFSPALQGLVSVMLAKDPALRPRDAGEVMARLRQAEERDALITQQEVVPEPEVEMEMEAMPADEGADMPSMTVARLPDPAAQRKGKEQAPGHGQALAPALAAPVSVREIPREAPSMPVPAPAGPPEEDWGEEELALLGGKRRGLAQQVLVAILCVLVGAAGAFGLGTLAYRLYRRMQPPPAQVSVRPSVAPASAPAPVSASAPGLAPVEEPPPAPLQP